MNWQVFRILHRVYGQELSKGNYERALELNQEIYKEVFQKYLKLPQGKQKQVLQITLNILGETALTIEDILLKEAEN